MELSYEAEYLFSLLLGLGLSKEEVNQIEQQLKNSSYFTLKLIRISETLQEFERRRITLEISD